MPKTRPSAREMALALERWGLERWPRLRAFYAPLREAAAKEAEAQRALTKPKATRTGTPPVAPVRPNPATPRPGANPTPTRPKAQ